MTRHIIEKVKARSPFKFLPCLRCGQFTVTALIIQPFEELDLRDLVCKRCAAPHFLTAKFKNGMWWAFYDRDTRRYPPDYYDESPFVVIKQKDIPFSHLEDDDTAYPNYGPVMVYRRKYFSRDDIQTIWLQSRRRCHLCGKRWKLKERARDGWHVDHVIPNNGGGKDTEMMDNFLVACARCNLKKGRGYTPRMVSDALKSLFD